ncbi:copper chaperone PCu(A)C [Marinobacteraceae bacterium S3BR75-40.1]
MKLLFNTTLALTLLMTSAVTLAHDYATDGIKVGHPWARPTPPVAPINAAAYMTLSNETDHVITLSAVSTPLTAMASVHQTREVDGQMRMEPVKEGLAIPAGETVELKPGSYHLMLMKLSEPLEEGDEFPLTLTFSDDITLDVKVSVESP